jgi:dTMP kinase
MQEKGKLIVFEGIDGSGKSTISKMVSEFLRENKIEHWHTREPTTTSIYGKLFRENLQKDTSSIYEDLMLILLDRFYHVKEIREKLNNGINVICDRYTSSTLAYQTLQGFDPEVIEMFNKIPNEKVYPDLELFLEVEPEIALERIKSTREVSEKYDHIAKLEKLTKNYSDQKVRNRVIIKSEPKIRDTFNKCMIIINKLLRLY